jgi:hypothetical protein
MFKKKKNKVSPFESAADAYREQQQKDQEESQQRVRKEFKNRLRKLGFTLDVDEDSVTINEYTFSLEPPSGKWKYEHMNAWNLYVETPQHAKTLIRTQTDLGEYVLKTSNGG